MLSNGLCAAILGIFTSAIAMILFIIDNAVLWNVPKVLSASERKLAYATMTTMWYILLGSVCIKFIEHWDLETSCQFAVVTLLTIGYGNIAPKTIGGRFFMMLYTIIGLGIFGFYAVAFEENILESAKREAIVQIDLMSRMLKGAKRSNPGSLAITQGGSGGNANSNGYGSVYSSRAEFSGVPIQRFWSTDSYLAGSGNHLNELPLSTTLTMVPTMGSSFSEHSLAIYPTERSELGAPTRRDTHVSHPLSHSMLLPLSRTHSMSGEVEKILAEFEKQWLSHWKAIRAVLFTVGVWLTSAGIFAVLEPRWSYLESMYFCFVTMTGIGYGDFVPERPWAIEYWYIFIFIAVGIFAFFVGLVGEHIGVRFASQHAKTVERMTQRELKYRKRKADEEQRAYQLRMHQQQHKMNVGDHAQEGKGKAGYGKAAAGHPEETVLGRRLTHEPASHHEP
ncbi:hypothetical protein BC831DRAFT_73880 [Entophlyctis helioformis]|nr:hypothetical protein BC831DRAFT_73880 [Entophlyctis helioformis]